MSMIRPEPPFSSTEPVRPDPPNLSARMRAGRARIVLFLAVQGAAQGLFWSLPALLLISLSFERLPVPAALTLKGASFVSIGICVTLGAFFRWNRLAPSWPKIWDRCHDETGLIETVHFLERSPQPTTLSEDDSWQASLRSQATSLRLPSKAELRSVMPNNSGLPPTLSVILLLLWFSVIPGQIFESGSTTIPNRPLASETDLETHSTIDPQNGNSVLGEDPADQNRPESVVSESAVSESVLSGLPLVKMNDPSEPSRTDPSSSSTGPASTNDSGALSDSTQIEPLAASDSGLQNSTGLDQDPGNLPGSSLRQPGGSAEPRFRDSNLGSGGLADVTPEQTVPAQRSATDLSMIRSLSGEGQGAWQDRREDSSQISEDSPAGLVPPQPRTGPLQFPPRWQKLLDRYMKLRDGSEESEGRR